MAGRRQLCDAKSRPAVHPHNHLARFLRVCQGFGGVLAKPGGYWNAGMAVYHKGVMRVVDHARKFHLQNTVKLLSHPVDIEIKLRRHVFLPIGG
jgi:hypothetical protein